MVGNIFVLTSSHFCDFRFFWGYPQIWGYSIGHNRCNLVNKPTFMHQKLDAKRKIWSMWTGDTNVWVGRLQVPEIPSLLNILKWGDILKWGYDVLASVKTEFRKSQWTQFFLGSAWYLRTPLSQRFSQLSLGFVWHPLKVSPQIGKNEEISSKWGYGQPRDVCGPRAIKTSEMDSRAVGLSPEQKIIEIGAWSSEIQLLKVFGFSILRRVIKEIHTFIHPPLRLRFR